MLNSPVNPFTDDTVAEADSELIAPGSPVRLTIIGLIFGTMAVVIIARVAWVKTQLPDDYLSAIEATTTDFERIPARDGRILAGSTVLAADVEKYSVEVHYRWLQEPPDSNWLQKQVRERLTRTERRQAELVARVEADVLSERTDLHHRLRDLFGISEVEFHTRRRDVQQRVERIAESVNQRHQTEASTTVSLDNTGPLIRVIAAIREALTTAPRRDGRERIILREEESWHAIATGVSLSIAAEISEHPELFPGTRAIVVTDRVYPQGRLAAHAIGARTKRTDDELTVQRPSLKTTDSRRRPADGQNSSASDADQQRDSPARQFLSERIGRFGVELTMHDRLGGQPGVRRNVRNRRQQIIATEIIHAPVSGRDVVLSIDVELQAHCEQLLAEALHDEPLNLLRPIEDGTDDPGTEGTRRNESPPQPLPVGGSIVVMEPDTGRLLAAASAPGFDLALFTSRSVEDWRRIHEDQRQPFVARYLGMALPPGSTFKMLTACAGLDTGVIDENTVFDCQGFLSRPDEHRCLIFRQYGRGHGSIRLKSALAQSCNVYFFDAARRMGLEPLTDWSRRLGFGQPSGIDLPFEKFGNVPTANRISVTSATSSSSLSSAASGETPGNDPMRANRIEREALGLAIGQSRLTVTPLQMARMMAAIANGGYLVTPHIVSDEGLARRASESPDEQFPSRTIREKISGLDDVKRNAIITGLVAAIEEPSGTGYRTVRLPELRIAGKTGTAEASPGKPDHAWFTGFAPVDRPQFIIVVTLEHGGSGSHAAGPVARKVFQFLASRAVRQ